MIPPTAVLAVAAMNHQGERERMRNFDQKAEARSIANSTVLPYRLTGDERA